MTNCRNAAGERREWPDDQSDTIEKTARSSNLIPVTMKDHVMCSAVGFPPGNRHTTAVSIETPGTFGWCTVSLPSPC